MLPLYVPFAYIDPSTASQIIMVVSGIVISCAITLGILRTRIVMFFQKQKIARMEKRIRKENAEIKNPEIKAEEVKAEEVKAEEVKAEEVKDVEARDVE